MGVGLHESHRAPYSAQASALPLSLAFAHADAREQQGQRLTLPARAREDEDHLLAQRGYAALALAQSQVWGVRKEGGRRGGKAC